MGCIMEIELCNMCMVDGCGGTCSYSGTAAEAI